MNSSEIKGLANALREFFPSNDVAIANAEALVSIMDDGIVGARSLVLSTWQKEGTGWRPAQVTTGALHMTHQIIHCAIQLAQYGYKLRMVDGKLQFRHRDGSWDILASEAMEAHGDSTTITEFERCLDKASPVAAALGNVGFAMAPDCFNEDGTWRVSKPWVGPDGTSHLMLHGINFRFLFAQSVQDPDRVQVMTPGLGQILRLMNEAAGQANATATEAEVGQFGSYADYRGVGRRQGEMLRSLLYRYDDHKDHNEDYQVFVPGSIMTRLLGSKDGLLYGLNGPRREGGCFLSAAYDGNLAATECRIPLRTKWALQGSAIEPHVGSIVLVRKNPDMRQFPLTVVGFTADHSIHVSPRIGPCIAADGDGDTLGVLFHAGAADMTHNVLSINPDATYVSCHEPGMPMAFLGIEKGADDSRVLAAVTSSITSKLLMAPAVALRAAVGMVDALKAVNGQDVLDFLSSHDWALLDMVNTACGTAFTKEMCQEWVVQHDGVVQVAQEVSRPLAEVAINKHIEGESINDLKLLMDLAVTNVAAAFTKMAVLAKLCKHIDVLMGLAAIKVAMRGQMVSDALRAVPKGRKIFMSPLGWEGSGRGILEAFASGIHFDSSDACALRPSERRSNAPDGAGDDGQGMVDKDAIIAEHFVAKFSALVGKDRVKTEVFSNGSQEALDARYALRAIAQSVGGIVTYPRGEDGKVTATITNMKGQVVASGIPYCVYSNIHAVFATRVVAMRNVCSQCGTFISNGEGFTCQCGNVEATWLTQSMSASEYLAWRMLEDMPGLKRQLNSAYQQSTDPEGVNRGHDIRTMLKQYAERLFLEPGSGEAYMRQSGHTVGRVVLDIDTDTRPCPSTAGSLHPAEQTIDTLVSAMVALQQVDGLCIAGTSTSKPGTTAAVGTDNVPEMVRQLVLGHQYIDPARYSIVNSALCRTRQLVTGGREWYVMPQTGLVGIHPETVVGLVAYHDLDDGMTDLEQIAVSERLSATVSYPCTEQVLVPDGVELLVSSGYEFIGGVEVATGCWYRVAEYGAPIHTIEVVGTVSDSNCAIGTVKVLVHTTRSMINDDGSYTEGKWIDTAGNKGMTRRMTRQFSTVLLGQTQPVDVVMNASRMCGSWVDIEKEEGSIRVWESNGKMKTGQALLNAILSQVAFYQSTYLGKSLPILFDPDITFTQALNLLEQTCIDCCSQETAWDSNEAGMLRLSEKLSRIEQARDSGTDDNTITSLQYRLAFLPLVETTDTGDVVVKDEVLMGFMPFLIQPLDIHQGSTMPVVEPDFRTLREVNGHPVLNLKPNNSRSGFSIRREYDYVGCPDSLKEFFFSDASIVKYDSARVWLAEQLLRVLFQTTMSLTTLNPVAYPHWVEATGEGHSFETVDEVRSRGVGSTHRSK